MKPHELAHEKEFKAGNQENRESTGTKGRSTQQGPSFIYNEEIPKKQTTHSRAVAPARRKLLRLIGSSKKGGVKCSISWLIIFKLEPSLTHLSLYKISGSPLSLSLYFIYFFKFFFRS